MPSTKERKIMKFNILACLFAGLFSVTSTCHALSVQESNPAETLSTISLQQQIDLNPYTSKRQIVDQLLADALIAFKSPARISHAGFTAKMPSNMEIVTDRLLEAYKIEPYRLDLLFSAANAQVYNKNIDEAVKIFEQIIQAAPADLDAHTYLATWYRFQGNTEKSKAHFEQIKTLNAGRADDLSKIFAEIDSVVKTPLKTEAIAHDEKTKTAIITLGYALNADGSMHPILMDRLNTTLALAKQNPNALIMLTGGVPKNNQTEGKLMADWLEKNGVERSRIVEENYARTTIENALFTTYALAKHKVEKATIVSSASHVRRGQTLFEIASWQTGPVGIQFETVATVDKPLNELVVPSKEEMLGIYRDALSTYGLWSYRSYPLQQR